MNIREWLQQEPDVADLIEINGAFTHPYEAIVRKLNMLCWGFVKSGMCGNERFASAGWDTVNFKHQYIIFPDGSIKVSGSVEVVIKFLDENWELVKRTLSGAATFDTKDYCNETETNTHFAATVKSLAIVNAVQVLGKQFGWGLNSGTLPTEQLNGERLTKFQKKVKAAVKVKPDEGIKAQWNRAVEIQNTTMVKYLLAMYTITPGEDGFHFVKIEE